MPVLLRIPEQTRRRAGTLERKLSELADSFSRDNRVYTTIDNRVEVLYVKAL